MQIERGRVINRSTVILEMKAANAASKCKETMQI